MPEFVMGHTKSYLVTLFIEIIFRGPHTQRKLNKPQYLLILCRSQHDLALSSENRPGALLISSVSTLLFCFLPFLLSPVMSTS